MARKIIIIGLNPAWQRTLIFKSFKPGGINRCEEVMEYASGKGVNAAFAVKRWSETPIVLQFTGGDSGRSLCRDLHEFDISYDSVDIKDHTRLCQTLIYSSKSTELIDPSPKITCSEAQILCDRASRFKSSDALWVFSGTFPSGFTEKYLRKLIKDIPSSKIILDGINGVIPILKHGIFILKINREELIKLTGKKSVSQAWTELKKYYSIEHLIVTDGARPLNWLSGSRLIQYKIPECEKFVNPIGAGDAFTGSLAALLQKGMPLEKIVPYAIGTSIAKCESRFSFGFSVQRVKFYIREAIRQNSFF